MFKFSTSVLIFTLVVFIAVDLFYWNISNILLGRYKYCTDISKNYGLRGGGGGVYIHKCYDFLVDEKITVIVPLLAVTYQMLVIVVV